MNLGRGFLLIFFTGLSRAISADDPLGAPPKVHAYVGFPVVLPCRQKLPEDLDFPTVEWSKPGLTPHPYVFVLRDKFEMQREKHKDFESRTYLFMSEADNGNFDMKLWETRKEDKGTYICKTMWDRNRYNEKTVELIVEDFPLPKLSVVSMEGGAVNLSCRVQTCSPGRPRLTFWDGHGRFLKADNEHRTQESGECYRLERQLTAQADAKSVMCRADFPNIGHSRDVYIVIPEYPKESNAFPMVCVGTGVGFLLGLAAAAAGAFLIHRFSGKSSEKKSVSPSSSSGSQTKSLNPPQYSRALTNEETGEMVILKVPDPPSPTHTSTVSKAGSVVSSNDDDDAEMCKIQIKKKPVKFQGKARKSRKKKNQAGN